MKVRSIVSVICLVLAPLLPGCTGSPKPRTFVGLVHIYGSEPHTSIGIEDEEDGQVYGVQEGTAGAAGGEFRPEDLRTLQGRRIEFTVKVISPRAAYPPGMDGTVEIVSWRVLD
jgi:hypothetical protein